MGTVSVFGLGGGGLPEFGAWKVVSSRDMTSTSGCNAVFDISDLITAKKDCFVVAVVSSVSGIYNYLSITGGALNASLAKPSISKVNGTIFAIPINSSQGSSLFLSGSEIYAATGSNNAGQDIQGILYVIEEG